MHVHIPHTAGFKGTLAFMGDLNAEPPEDAMQFLIGNRTLGGAKTEGLFDAWDRLRPGEDGLTFNTLHDTLAKRIDFIMLRLAARDDASSPARLRHIERVPTEEEHYAGKGARDEDGELVEGEEDEPVASDHLGVYVDLHMP